MTLAFGDRHRRHLVALPEAVKSDKRVKKACAAYERVVGELEQAKAALGTLFTERERAEHARLEREAEALVHGRKAAATDARDFDAEIGEARRRLETAERALDIAQVELDETFEKHRTALLQDAAERVTAAAATYAAAVDEIERARRAFWHERRIEAWVREFPRARKGVLPQGDVHVRGIVNEQTGEPYEWRRVRGALSAEIDPPTPPAPPAHPPTKLRPAILGAHVPGGVDG